MENCDIGYFIFNYRLSLILGKDECEEKRHKPSTQGMNLSSVSTRYGDTVKNRNESGKPKLDVKSIRSMTALV